MLQYEKAKLLGVTIVFKTSKPTINMETDATFDWEEANGCRVHVGRNDIHDFAVSDINWYLAAGVKHTLPGRAVINKVRPAIGQRSNWLPMDEMFGNADWRTANDAPDTNVMSLMNNQTEYNTGSRPGGQIPTVYAIGMSNWPQPRNNVATVQNNYSFGVDAKVILHFVCKQPVVP